MFSEKNINKNNFEYNALSIKVLDGLDAVRKRPGMYIGDIEDGLGLHQMALEIFNNSIDEALAGFCNKINVIIHKDNSITVEDNGRGIPIDLHESGKIACEIIMCTLHSGGKFDSNTYKVSGGLHGVGVSVVNALSTRLQLDIRRNNIHYRQWFSQGYILSHPVFINKFMQDSGTSVRFWADKEIFSTIVFQTNYMLGKLQEQAFLNKNLTICLTDVKTKKFYKYFFSEGISFFVKHINSAYSSINQKIIYLKGTQYKNQKKYFVEASLQWNNTYKHQIKAFTNNIYNVQGGSHLSGFKTALTRSLHNYINEIFFKQSNKISILGEDVREGLVAIISIKCPDPKFSSQIKEKLVSSEIKGMVDGVIYEKLNSWLRSNSVEASKISQKIIHACKTRENIKKNKDINRKKYNFDNTLLPGKLTDCISNDPNDSEIFIVEGESAGGSAKSGRNKYIQAILPLRGKILNVEKSHWDKIFSNKEIISILIALGAGLSIDEFNINKIRYKKIIIMTDADVDGSHIKTLLLTFFYRQMRSLVGYGYLYISKPPLYRVKLNKRYIYFINSEMMQKNIIKTFFDNIFVFNKDNKLITSYLKTRIQYIFSYVSEIVYWTLKYDKIILNISSSIFMEKSFYITINHKQKKIFKMFFYNKLHKFTNGKYFYMGRKIFFICEADAESNKMKYLQLLMKSLSKILKTSFKIVDKKNIVHHSENLELFMMYIKKHVNKSFDVQRYKGLGEMNPIQLWNTTMNPKTRAFLKIKVNDYVKTNKIFTKIMGDVVEERKKLVEYKKLNFSKLFSTK